MKIFSLLLSLSLLVSCSNNNGARNTTHSSAIKLTEEAVKLQLQNQSDLALTYLDSAIKIDPKNINAHITSIQIAVKKHNYERALQSNFSLKLLQPNSVAWMLQSGAILELSGDVNRAKTEYKYGLEHHLKNIKTSKKLTFDLEFQLVECLIWNDQYHAATEKLETLKNKYPDQLSKDFILQSKDELLNLMRQ